MVRFIAWEKLPWQSRFCGLFVLLFGLLEAPVFMFGFYKRGLSHGAIAIAAFVVCLLRFKNNLKSLQNLDWRIGSILIATLFAIAGTMFVYALGIGHDPATFFGAIYAGWIGGLALFVLIGAAVAIVSLVRPEEESFDSRARILFRRETGRHIDYIVDRMKHTFEHYSESVVSVLTVHDYDPPEKKFFISWKCATTIRSYIDDVDTFYESSIDIREVTPPPSGKQSNRLAFYRVAEGPYGGQDFTTELKVPFSATIAKGGVCEVEHQMDYWVRAEDEENEYSPKRYSQSVTLQVENHLGKNLDLRLSLDQGKTYSDLHLRPGERRVVARCSDIKPSVQVYDIRLRPLT
jgi:hypothetical protein